MKHLKYFILMTLVININSLLAQEKQRIVVSESNREISEVLKGKAILHVDKEGNILSKEEFQELTKAGSKFNYKIAGDTVYFQIAAESKTVKSDFLGSEFPKISLKFLNRPPREKAVKVYNFWFVACRPCIEEIPKLNKLVDKYGDKIEFIAPTFDSEDKVRNFLNKKEFKYNIAYDAFALLDSLNITIFPTHIIVVDNIIIFMETGSEEGVLEKLEETLLKT